MAKKVIRKTTSGVRTPFQVIDALFEIDKERSTWGIFDKAEKQFAKLSDKDKQRNFFVVNRRLAIKYPLQAFKLSQNGVNPIYAIDSWYMITLPIARKVKRIPKWIYLKLEKGKAQKKLSIKEEAKDYYIKLNQISEKDFEMALKFKPTEVRDYLKLIEKQLKIISKNQN